VKILVANKVDMPDYAVEDSRGKKLAEDHCIKFFRNSAMTGENIAESFKQLAG
jgi:hypothetical protein